MKKVLVVCLFVATSLVAIGQETQPEKKTCRIRVSELSIGISSSNTQRLSHYFVNSESLSDDPELINQFEWDGNINVPEYSTSLSMTINDTKKNSNYILGVKSVSYNYNRSNRTYSSVDDTDTVETTGYYIYEHFSSFEVEIGKKYFFSPASTERFSTYAEFTLSMPVYSYLSVSGYTMDFERHSFGDEGGGGSIVAFDETSSFSENQSVDYFHTTMTCKVGGQYSLCANHRRIQPVMFAELQSSIGYNFTFSSVDVQNAMVAGGIRLKI